MKKQKSIFKQLLSIKVSIILLFNPIYAADLEVDGTTNTTLDTSRNGIPIVNIANPNSKGLSHNKYKNYNVNSNGLILNNSKELEVNTQLAGYIYGNSNLSNNASVILNEITSTNKSYINGYTEIAGQKADMVIANPNGISINGAGFINTRNLTLTTGIANIVNQEINSYSIQDGEIVINEDGLNTQDQENTDIYSHYLKLNGQVNAKKLNIKLGKNEIDASSRTITSSSNSESTNLLLDSSALGGMYANSIYFEGTSDGLGANFPDEVVASAGEIVIDNDGNIVLEKLNSSDDITVVTQNHTIEIQDNIYASKGIDLKSDDLEIDDVQVVSKEETQIDVKNLTNNGDVISGVNEDETLNDDGIIEIKSDEIVNNGTINSTKSLSLNNTNTITNTGEIKASDELNIYTKDITNQKDIKAGNNLKIEASNTITNNTTNSNINSLGSIDIDANSLDNSNAKIIFKDDGIIDISQNLDNTNAIIQSQEKSLNLSSNHINLENGNIEALQDITLTQNTQTTTSTSKVFAQRDLTYNLNNQGLTNDFTLESGSNINININGDFTSSKDLLSNANLSLNTNGNSIINNANHSISADNEINLYGSSLENNGIISAKEGTSNLEFTGEITNNSRISSAENLIVSGSDITNNGAINSGIDLIINANNIENNQTIFSNNNMNLYVTNNLTNNQNSNIFAMKDLIIAKNSSHEKTNLIENISANIESYEGDINIWATTLNNKNPQNLSELYTYENQTEKMYFSSVSQGSRRNGSIFYLDQYTNDGYGAILNNYSINLFMDHNGNHESGSLTVTLNIPVLRNNITGLASIYSGNDLNLTVDTINNELSKISSGNNIHFDTNSLINKSGSYNGTVRWVIDKCDGILSTYCGNTSSWMQKDGSSVRIGQQNDRESSTFNYTLTDVLSFDSTIQAQGSITGSINQVNNGTIVQNQNLESITQQSANTSTKTVGTNSLSSQTLSADILPTSEYGLFILSKDPTSDYLIETNSEFTNRDNFLSSNYMLERIGFSPDEHVKKLGDGLYEQRLVSEQIFVQTGRAFLDDTYTNNQSQYQYLMDNAVDVSQDINLVAGVALTKEQIEALKVDIVWMEEKIINGQKVLAPKYI
jgi:filamentous hemagglutinin